MKNKGKIISIVALLLLVLTKTNNGNAMTDCSGRNCNVSLDENAGYNSEVISTHGACGVGYPYEYCTGLASSATRFHMEVSGRPDVYREVILLPSEQSQYQSRLQQHYSEVIIDSSGVSPTTTNGNNPKYHAYLEKKWNETIKKDGHIDTNTLVGGTLIDLLTRAGRCSDVESCEKYLSNKTALTAMNQLVVGDDDVIMYFEPVLIVFKANNFNETYVAGSNEYGKYDGITADFFISLQGAVVNQQYQMKDETIIHDTYICRNNVKGCGITFGHLKIQCYTTTTTTTTPTITTTRKRDCNTDRDLYDLDAASCKEQVQTYYDSCIKSRSNAICSYAMTNQYESCIKQKGWPTVCDLLIGTTPSTTPTPTPTKSKGTTTPTPRTVTIKTTKPTGTTTPTPTPTPAPTPAPSSSEDDCPEPTPPEMNEPYELPEDIIEEPFCSTPGFFERHEFGEAIDFIKCEDSKIGCGQSPRGTNVCGYEHWDVGTYISVYPSNSLSVNAGTSFTTGIVSSFKSVTHEAHEPINIQNEIAGHQYEVESLSIQIQCTIREIDAVKAKIEEVGKTDCESAGGEPPTCSCDGCDSAEACESCSSSCASTMASWAASKAQAVAECQASVQSQLEALGTELQILESKLGQLIEQMEGEQKELEQTQQCLDAFNTGIKDGDYYVEVPEDTGVTVTNVRIELDGYGTINANSVTGIQKGNGKGTTTTGGNVISVGGDNFYIDTTVPNGTHGRIIYTINVPPFGSFEIECDILIINPIVGPEPDPVIPPCTDDSCEPIIPTCTDDNDCEDGSGYNLIFRPISLTTPFPNNRPTTGLWYDNVINRIITNNRDVSDYEVYNLTPMYTITLTPSDIKEIREYNKENSYADFTLECTKGLYCRSTFLRNSFPQIVNTSNSCAWNSWYGCDSKTLADYRDYFLNRMK